MESKQTQGARQLLNIIQSAVENGQQLTYSTAADLMGRRPAHNHTRAVSKMCNLLDAAACLAGRPSLALVKVLESSGEINQRAWVKEFPTTRTAIIERSLRHKWDDSDFMAISDALAALGDRGAMKAWEYIFDLYPGDALYRRLIGEPAESTTAENRGNSAIDDLGTDTPDRAKNTSWTYARNPKVREAVMRRAKGDCEFCGVTGFVKADGSKYLETHHIIALANEGADRATNVIALCANDHRRAHYARDAKEIERQMVRKLQAISGHAQRH